MKKFMILASVVAIVVAALALPALASDRSLQDRFEKRYDKWQERADQRGYDEAQSEAYFYERWANFYGFKDDRNNNRDPRNNNRDDRNNDNEVVPAVSQSFEQEAESGDVDQSFNVKGGGDNSNQCVGINGTANTGNIQTQSGFILNGSEIDDFEQDDIGNDLTVNGTSEVSCEQRVNQSAVASGR